MCREPLPYWAQDLPRSSNSGWVLGGLGKGSSLWIQRPAHVDHTAVTVASHVFWKLCEGSTVPEYRESRDSTKEVAKMGSLRDLEPQ